ncbi:MAG TPA: NADH-ubiquinone oxidoreductase-F iron-sulfur binding region domain-containing protein [Candidatus Saccharimonadales bacterium]|nr:NADH-ubiquinone oxidoreductase-F iron-sulfur binding region domain-containing protein [Candidatus Saccharimonadales bacterium]
MAKTLNILQKIRAAGLVGRGGARYPTAKKWSSFEQSLKTRAIAYIVVNGAEGEPGIKKDAYLLAEKTEAVINGVYLAEQFFGSDKIKKIYFFLKREYYRDYSKRIKEILNTKKYRALSKKIVFFIKPESPTYICGEETAIINIISGQRPEPRLKPPFPTESGIHNHPTLVNNVETFYDISLVGADNYQGHRLYTLSGAVKHRGVFSLPAIMSVREILQATNNYPTFDFFVMTGGEVCGELWRSDQLQNSVEGSGLIMVFDKQKTDLKKLLAYWLKFYEAESCGLCVACREGGYRLRELSQQANYDKQLFVDLLDNLEDSSFCALGSSLALTVKSLQENIK